jgi:membrane dipeptidase
MQELAAQFGPAPQVGWERIIDHIDHVVKVAGIDHVGLGSDFDGGSLPEGMREATGLPKITDALVRKGYSDRDIRKILGLNTLRLMANVEAVAAK